MTIKYSPRTTINGAILVLALLLMIFIGHSGWQTWQVRQNAEQHLFGSRINTLVVRVTTLRAVERALTMARLSDGQQVDPDLQRELRQVQDAGDEVRERLIAAVQQLLHMSPDFNVLRLQLAQEAKHNRLLVALRKAVDQPVAPGVQWLEPAETFDVITQAIEYIVELRDIVDTNTLAQAGVDPNLQVIEKWAADASELAGQGRGQLTYFIGARQPIPLPIRMQLHALHSKIEHRLDLLREMRPLLGQTGELPQAILNLNQAFTPEFLQMRKAIFEAAASGDYPVDRAGWLALANRAVGGLSAVAAVASRITDALATTRQQDANFALMWLVVLGILSMGLVALAFRQVGATALSLESQRNRAEQVVTELTEEIDHRRQLEQDLRRYQVMVSTSPDLISLIDPDYTYRIVNSTYLRVHDRSRGQIEGKRVAELLGEQVFEEQVRGRLDRCLTGETVNYDTWFDLPGNGRRYMDVTYFPYHDEAGVVAGAVVSIRDVTELKIAEETLRERGEQLRTITDAMPGLVMQLDREYHYRFINQTGAEWFGLPAASLIGRDMCDVIGATRFSKIQSHYEEAFSGKLITFERQMPCADGVKRWVQLTLVPKAEQNGQVESLYVLGTDITYRKQVEETLQSSQASFRSIVEQNHTGIVVLDIEGSSLYCNPTACSMLSKLPEAGACRIGMLNRLQKGNNELEITHKDDTPGVAQVLVSDTDWQGNPARLVLLQDITKRKAAEAELRASRESLHRLLNSMYEGVYGVDRDGNCTFVNKSFLEILGYQDASEVLGKHIHTLIHHTHADGTPYPANAYRMYSASQSHQPVNVSDEVFWRKDGKPVPVEYWSHPIVSEGEVVGAIATFIDITERKRAEAELLQLNESLEQRVLERTTDLEHARREADSANRAKSAFLATMSHEIRTPMNGVIGMVSVLEQSDLTAHQADLVTTVRDSANALLRIIDDILDFSKIEAGRMELDHEPVCLEELVEGLCYSLVPVAARKKVDLNLFVSPDVPAWVLSDDVRLRQLFYNLVGNAIKFSAGRPGKPGQVSIRVEVVQGEPLRLTCSVADNGIGMSPETVDGLFTPFTQAEISTTRKYGGTGLGLAICKRLVDLMAGEIGVESTPGAGSVFSFTLPFEIAPEQPAREQPDIAGLECLLVDSPDINSDDLRVYLEHAGAVVRQVNDAASAVEVASQMAAPVIILGATQVSAEVAELERVPDAKRLLITRGRRRRARVESRNTVTLDGGGMNRLTLLRAVAVVAGRASPEIAQERAENYAVRGQAPTIAEARARNQLILVAEDDRINQKVILQQLALLGYAAEIAGDGAEALQMWREGRYAVLLTDLHMPEMDGYRLAETIRREETGGLHRPIMALTANALRGEANRAYAAGMDEYLTKPVKLPELRAVLEKWLSLVPKVATAVTDTAVYQPRPDVPLDITVLQGLVGDDPDIVREFLTDYRSSAGRLVVEMRAASDADDPQHVRAVAHKLKSSSRSVGALALGDLCAELENACGSGNKSAIVPGVQTVEAALAEVEGEIKRVLQGDGLDSKETTRS